MAGRIFPIDIVNQRFPRRMKGLDPDHVYNFLEEVSLSLEMALAENTVLKERMESVEAEIARYKSMEKTLQEALILAQKTAEEKILSAQKEAELILQQAQGEKLRMFQQYNQDVADIKQQLSDLDNEKQRYIAQLRGLTASLSSLLENGQKLVPATTEQPSSRATDER